MRRDERLGEDVARPAVGDDAARVEQHHPVGVLGSEREVVHRGDQREPRLAAKEVEQLERLLLMADVERGRRLVEEHDASLLRERPRDDDALPLAARERAEAAVAVREKVEPLERARRDLAIATALLRQAAQMRRSPHEDVFRDRHPRRRRGVLRDDGDDPRQLRALQLPRVAPVERDRAGERDESRDRPQQRGLARAVRPDQAEPLAVGDLEVDRRRPLRGSRGRP